MSNGLLCRAQKTHRLLSKHQLVNAVPPVRTEYERSLREILFEVFDFLLVITVMSI